MNEDYGNDAKALFARYRATRPISVPEPSVADAIMLAAWSERRLDDMETAEIELLLSSHPQALDDVLAALVPVEAETASSELIGRLQNLVPKSSSDREEAATNATVLVYRPRRHSSVGSNRAGTWLSWGAIAASLLVVSVAGLGVGLTAGQSLTDSGDQSRASLSELLDSTSWMSDEVG